MYGMEVQFCFSLSFKTYIVFCIIVTEANIEGT
jgi:hypothetical protein